MRTLRIWTSLGLAVCLALAAVGGRGAVVCMGADGHLAVEFGCFGDATSSPELPGAGASDGHCGACVDTPLVADAARVAVAQREHSGAGMSFAVFTEDAAPFVRPLAAIARPLQDTPPIDLPRALRATVLLI